ncbi:MAG: hypothetical protein DMF49_10730 [Acidobacteria bacterium]|nr:MAG: hypothetical protein DMF49_10730 [Acidobacteriota bacterium]
MRRFTFRMLLVFVFVMPMENAWSAPGLGRLSHAAGLALAGFWILTVLMTHRFRKPREIHLLVALFVLWNGLSVLWSHDTSMSFLRFLTYVQVLGQFLIVWDLADTPETLRAAMQAYVLGAFISIGSAIQNYRSGNQYYSQRYSGAGLQVNDLGLILAIGIPIAWYLAFVEPQRARRWLRWANVLYIPASLFGILLGASRGAMLGVVPAALFAALSLRRLNGIMRTLLLGSAIASYFLLAALVPHASVERIGTIGDELTNGDLNGRVRIWREGMSVFGEHPLFGIGTGAFRSAVDVEAPAHNFAVALLAEVGLVGFTLFSLVLLFVFRDALLQPGSWRALWLTVLAIWLIAAGSHNWEHRKQTWLFFCLIAASAAFRPRQAGPAAGAPATGDPPAAVV